MPEKDLEPNLTERTKRIATDVSDYIVLMTTGLDKRDALRVAYTVCISLALTILEAMDDNLKEWALGILNDILTERKDG